MDTISSLSDSIYNKTFSPTFRNAVSKMTPTDMIVVFLCIIAVLYVLTQLFNGPLRKLWPSLCPQQEEGFNNTLCTVQAKELGKKDFETISFVDGKYTFEKPTQLIEGRVCLGMPFGLCGAGCTSDDLKVKVYTGDKKIIVLEDKTEKEIDEVKTINFDQLGQDGVMALVEETTVLDEDGEPQSVPQHHVVKEIFY